LAWLTDVLERMVAGWTTANAKLNGVDPQAWLTSVLARIAELLPWRYAAAAA
jgi:hypothetical protein